MSLFIKKKCYSDIAAINEKKLHAMKISPDILIRIYICNCKITSGSTSRIIASKSNECVILNLSNWQVIYAPFSGWYHSVIKSEKESILS